MDGNNYSFDWQSGRTLHKRFKTHRNCGEKDHASLEQRTGITKAKSILSLNSCNAQTIENK